MSKREATDRVIDASKLKYAEKLKRYSQEYRSFFLVNIDNVGSDQLHKIRISLRGEAVLLMGKNTMIRKIIRAQIPEFERILPHIKKNVGFVFTNGDLKEIRDKMLSHRVAAPARAGAVAPADVVVPAGNTGMEPGKTAFFQALGIATKIARGTIEITNDVKLVHKDEKVGASEATLLNMLNISPFTYGLGVTRIFSDGSDFSNEVLDVEESALVGKLLSAISQVASISLAVGYPTVASVPHSIVNGYKDLLAVSVATDFTFEGSEKIKEYLENPEAFAVAAPVAAAADSSAAPAAEEKAEESEESDEDMGLGLFD